MFEQLRIKVAIKQTITLGIMLIIGLSMIYLYSYYKMTGTIEDNLDILESTPFLGENNENYEERPPMLRDSLSIYIDKNNLYYLSDTDYYPNTTTEAIINYVARSKEPKSKIRVEGNYIAYRTETNFLGRFIYIYDYTKEFTALRNVGIIIAVSGSLGIITIALFSVYSAKKSVMPIENTFNKQQELVANASHELKTPLTIINADLSILNSSRNSFNPEQIKWIDSISSQVGRMSMLINDMLELARVDAVSEKQIFEAVSLSDIGYSVVLGAEVLAYENQITFTSKIEPDIRISGISANIEKLVYILVENALKYTNKGGEVDVNIYSERKRAILKVKNTGEGIDKDYLPKLFDRFYRADESRQSTGSFGLGLSIAKAIVDIHSGAISVNSKADEYTEFIVVFKQL